MAILTGVDGCKKGWLCILKDTDTAEISSKVFPNAILLLQQLSEAAIIAVDIPIGLSKDEYRLCDIEAKRILGSRQSSVFYTPVRSAIQSSSHKEANEKQKNICKCGLSKQAFCIFKKIRDFDEILSKQPQLQQRVKEVHPEVCFWAWNGNQPMPYAKKRTEGLMMRRNLITNYLGIDVIKNVRSEYLHKDVANDDIHDAFAALWTAERIMKGEAGRIPHNVYARDEKMLYMEIWY